MFDWNKCPYEPNGRFTWSGWFYWCSACWHEQQKRRGNS